MGLGERVMKATDMLFVLRLELHIIFLLRGLAVHEPRPIILLGQQCLPFIVNRIRELRHVLLLLDVLAGTSS